MNAIAAGNRDITLLSRAFNNVNATNVVTIETAEVTNGVLILTNSAGSTVSSNASTNTTTILTKELVDKFFAAGGIWAGKTDFSEVDLKGTTEIGVKAFRFKREIKSFQIPNTVTFIRESALADISLTSVFIPNSVISIDHGAFASNQISNLEFQEDSKLTSISDYSFSTNKLTSVKIPNSVKKIGIYSFFFNEFKSNLDITISQELLDSICAWDGNTVRENFERIFGVFYLNSFVDITPKATNDLSIWQINAIVNGDRNIVLLSRAFDNIDANNIKTITSASAENGVITLKGKDGGSVSSIASSNTTTILTKELTAKYFLNGEIWGGKKYFGHADLKGTTEIGEIAFYNSYISSINIPNSVTKIGYKSFSGSLLERLNFGNGIKIIEESSFSNCLLSSVIIPEGVIEIEEGAFQNNRLASATLPNSLITIGRAAFYNNNLQYVIIPQNVKTIGASAFKGNELKQANIPDSVTSIGSGAFTHLENEKPTFASSADITISKNVLRLICNWKGLFDTPIYGDGLTVKQNFQRIFGVIYREIPIVPKESFISDLWIMNAYSNGFPIPNNLNFLSKFFDGLHEDNIQAVSKVVVNSLNQFIVTFDGIDYTSAIPTYQTTVLSSDDASVYFSNGGIWYGKTKFDLNDLKFTTNIGDDTFKKRNLTSITIPNTVLTIGTGAFQNNKLTSVTIPNSITSIGQSSFIQTPNFVSFNNINISVETLDLVCSWNNKTVKDNFELIFGVSSPYDFSDIKPKSTNDLSIWEINAVRSNNKNWTVPLLSRAFEYVDNFNIKLIVKIEVNDDGSIILWDKNGNNVRSIPSTNTNTILTKELTDTYFAAGGIWDSVNIFSSSELRGTTVFGDETFLNKGLVSLIIPNTVHRIARSSFKNNNLTSLDIPNTINSIGIDSFKNNKLTSVTIGNGINKINDGVFQNNNLTSLDIPNSITSIGTNSFNNNNLTSVTIPNTITSIGKGAFIQSLNFSSCDDITIEKSTLDLICNWNKNKTIKQSFKLIFGVDFNSKFTDITPKATNDLSIWEMNAIENGNKNIATLSKAFDGIDETNIELIQRIIVMNDKTIALVNTTGEMIFSIPSTNTNTLLTKEITNVYFATGGIWNGKDKFSEVELKGTTEIREAAFLNKGLVSLIIPNTVTSIQKSAFQNNFLNSIIIPESIISIGDHAFDNNSIYKILFNGKNLQTIGINAFSKNKLKKVTIPNSILSIGQGAFIQIPNFVSSNNIEISNEVLMLDYINPAGEVDGTIRDNFKAIFGIDYLAYPWVITPMDISLPLTSLETNILLEKDINNPNMINILAKLFNGISKESIKTIQTISVNPDNYQVTLTEIKPEQRIVVSQIPSITNTSIIDRNIVSENFSPGGIWENKTSLTAKDLMGVTEISDYAFYSIPFNNSLTEIQIPNTITKIGDFAFQNTNLTKLTFEKGSSLDSIGSGAFNNNNLNSIEIPNSVSLIGEFAFQNNQLIELTFELGSKLTSIEDSAFSNNKLTGELIIPNSVITINDHAFSDNELTTLSFEAGSKLTSIEDSAFSNNKLTGELVIPSGVITINNNAFKNNLITSINIPNTVITIGNSAFLNNKITGELIIPNSIIEIGDKCFQFNELTSLKFEVGSKLNKLNDYGFANNKLTSVIIPDSITMIGNGAFRNNQLSSIEIPLSVIEIKSYAFANNLFNSYSNITINNLELLSKINWKNIFDVEAPPLTIKNIN